MTDQADLQALSDAARRCPTCKALDAEHNAAIANGLVIEARHVLRRTRAHEAEWHREALRAATPVVPDGLRGALEAVEWVQQFSNSRAECPWCGEYREDGHRAGCRRQAALAASPSPDTDREGEIERIADVLCTIYDHADHEAFLQPDHCAIGIEDARHIFAGLRPSPDTRTGGET